ncbi:MAG: AbrB/MazE/SpoVT family DNA-binding domain-containing protein [Patescibacteria group bacterium]|nr:AbrB/MazE/SpoVT family DNA-binding domain-containing protein [Patescibacteria group bacterium]
MKKKIKKGICTYKSGFYGWITVSEKGQIAIPADARKELNIKTGDKLLVLKRKDGNGLLLIKQKLLDKFLDKIREM